VILPVARRELLSAARNPKLYLWRVRVGVVEVIAAAVLSIGSQSRAGSGSAFWFLAAIALVFCLLDGLRKGADSISVEKREGTFGLLFLSGIGGLEVVLGKLASAMVRSLNGLLAFIPILALTLLLGGITGGEFWRVVLVLFITLVASTSLCLLISAVSTEDSAVWALAVLAGLCGLPPLVFGTAAWVTANPLFKNLAALSPVVLFNAASSAATLSSTRPFWVGVTALSFVSLASLFTASRIVRWNWGDQPSSSIPKKMFVFKRSQRKRAARKRELLDINPYYWLAFNPRHNRVYLGSLIAVLALAAITIICDISLGPNHSQSADNVLTFCLLAVAVIFLLGWIRVAAQGSSMLVEAQRSGFLELSIGTPIKPSDIIKGQWAALNKTIRPLRLTAVPVEIALIWLYSSQPGPFFITTLLLAQGVLGLYLIGWVGIWMALTSKTPGRAFFKTLMLGMMVPNFPCYCGLTVVIQFVLLMIARRKVQTALRALFSNLPVAGLSAPPLISAGEPPVIRFQS
jgi:hypothetical protein